MNFLLIPKYGREFCEIEKKTKVFMLDKKNILLFLMRKYKFYYLSSLLISKNYRTLKISIKKRSILSTEIF